MSEVITIFWELVGSGPLDLSVPLDLGSISSTPGETSEQELKVYYTTSGTCPKLTDCGLYLALYSLFYPNPQVSSAYQDWVETKRWGDLISLADKTGLLINMDKQNSYPSASWQPLSSSDGFSSYNTMELQKEAVQLSGGGYHDTDGELPLGANAFFKIKVSAPSGVSRTGNRYIGLVLDYEPAT